MNKSIRDFHNAVTPLRSFFLSKGFIEVHPQSEQSILAACEDPTTIATYDYYGTTWPLPQTGQMHLEKCLLENPNEKGFFCITTSYRQETNPIPGRHDSIFAMCEWESKGDIIDLIQLEKDLIKYIGFEGYIWEEEYSHIKKFYRVPELTAAQEELTNKDFGPILLLTNFPEYTSPFWNMKRNKDNTAAKIDVIMYGIETIGSAERETNVDTMNERFFNISNGDYARKLFKLFGRNRVLKELQDFLSLPMIPRFGGGIGMTRMIRAMKLGGIIL